MRSCTSPAPALAMKGVATDTDGDGVANYDRRGVVPPSWVPPGAIAYLDFVNGRYFADRAERTAAEIISTPGQIASGKLSIRGPLAPRLLGPVLADLQGGKWAVIIDFQFVVTTENTIMYLRNIDDSYNTSIWSQTGGSMTYDYGPVDYREIEGPGTPAGRNKIGVIRSGTGFNAISVNGSAAAICSDPFRDIPDVDLVLLGYYNPTQNLSLFTDRPFYSIAIYPLLRPDELPALTA